MGNSGHVYTLVVDAKTWRVLACLLHQDIVQCHGASFTEIWHVPNNIGLCFLPFTAILLSSPSHSAPYRSIVGTEDGSRRPEGIARDPH